MATSVDRGGGARRRRERRRPASLPFLPPPPCTPRRGSPSPPSRPSASAPQQVRAARALGHHRRPIMGARGRPPIAAVIRKCGAGRGGGGAPAAADRNAVATHPPPNTVGEGAAGRQNGGIGVTLSFVGRYRRCRHSPPPLPPLPTVAPRALVGRAANPLRHPPPPSLIPTPSSFMPASVGVHQRQRLAVVLRRFMSMAMTTASTTTASARVQSRSVRA